MNLSKVRIEIGLPAPLRLLHVSDTHLALADGRDGERKQALAARRSAAFGKEGDCVRTSPRRSLMPGTAAISWSAPGT